MTNLASYILIGKEPKLATDLREWGTWFKQADRSVARDAFSDVAVSTVFLGLDHQFADGPPLLFETMVFGGELDGACNRYATWEEAEHGHAIMVDRVRARL